MYYYLSLTRDKAQISVYNVQILFIFNELMNKILKKILLVALIVSPSILYLYIVNQNKAEPSAKSVTAEPSSSAQTPDH